MDPSRLKDIIVQLSVEPWPPIGGYDSVIEQLCPVARGIFLTEPSLLELRAPIKIVGDFLYTSLGSFFQYGGSPPKTNYLFLGNFVDRLGYHLRTILLLLAFKIRHPKNVYVVMGNHVGMQPQPCVDEVDEKSHFSSDSGSILDDCLKSLPVAALINDKIICTHGGLSPDLHHLDQIRHIKRPTYLPYSRLLLDLLVPNSRHVLPLGDKEVQFLEKHDLRLICCGLRQGVNNYKSFAEHRVVFISSASYLSEYNYTFKDDNNMMINVDADLKCSFHNLQHKSDSWSYHISMAAPTLSKCSSEVDLTCSTTMNNYGEHPPLRKVAESRRTKKVAETTNTNSHNDTGKTESRSKPATNPFHLFSSSSSLYSSKLPGVKATKRNTKPSNGSSNPTATTKSENSPGVTASTSKAASKNTSVSPAYMPAERMSNTNIGSKTVTFNPESSQEGTSSRPFDVDPATLYRSKSPGVKRFLGARV